MHSLSQKTKIFLGLLIAFLIVLNIGSFVLARNQEKAFLSGNSSSASLSPNDFKRQSSTIEAYLKFVEKDKGKAKVMGITTLNEERKWMEALGEALEKQDNKIDFSTLNTDGRNAARLANSGVISAVSDQQPDLLILNLPEALDQEEGMDPLAHQQALFNLYRRIRVASPNTAILFIGWPNPYLNKLNDENLAFYNKETLDYLQESELNVWTMWKASWLNERAYENGVLTEESMNRLIEETLKMFNTQKFSFNEGYKGENKDVAIFESYLSRESNQALAISRSNQEAASRARASQALSRSQINRQPSVSRAPILPTPSRPYVPQRPQSSQVQPQVQSQPSQVAPNNAGSSANSNATSPSATAQQ